MRLTEQVLRAIGWDTFGTLATLSITFLTTVWLVRLLGPESFGVLAALLALLGLSQILASGGIRQALLRFVPETMRKGGPEAVTHLLLNGVLGRTVILIVVTVSLWIGADAVASIGLGRPELARYVRLLPVLLALPLYADVLASSLIALFRQRTVRTAEVSNKIVFAFGLLMLPAWHDPIYGVFAAWVAGGATAIGWLVVDAVRQGLVRWPSWRGRGSTGRWVHFSGAAYALSLIGFVLGRELDILLLTRLGISSEAVAQYTVCFSFVAMVLTLPLLPIAGGFDVPLIASLYDRGDWDRLRRLFRAFFEYVYIFMLPLVGGGLLLGPSLVGLIYGDTYGTATDMLLPLLVALGLAKLGGITGPFLLGTDRERTLLKIRLMMAVFNVGVALAAIPRFGPPGAAMATGTALLGTVVWEGVVVHRFLHPRYPWRFLSRIAVSTGVMMATVRVGQVAIGPDLGVPPVLTLVALGGTVYLAMVLWLRPVSPEQGDIVAASPVPGLAWLVRRLGRDREPVSYGRA